MGQAAALSGLIGLTGPLGIVLKPPPVTWLGLISANIGYFIYAPFLSSSFVLIGIQNSVSSMIWINRDLRTGHAATQARTEFSLRACNARPITAPRPAKKQG